MSDRSYRALLGALMLVALTLDFAPLMYALIVMLLLEGLTNLRIPKLVNRLRRLDPGSMTKASCGMTPRPFRFRFEAERAWRLLIGSLLLLTYVLFYKTLWFFPWFLGFAIVGAGASGICPMEFSLKRLGFR